MSTENKIIVFKGSKLKWEYVDSFEANHEFEIENELADEDEDETIIDTEYSKGSVYYNKERNICIVFQQFKFEDEEFFEDDAEIVNYTEEKAFKRLIKYVNTHKNVTIHWTHVYMTTADFTIIENLPFEKIAIGEEAKKNPKLVSPDTISDIVANTKLEERKISPKHTITTENEFNPKYAIITSDNIRHEF